MRRVCVTGMGIVAPNGVGIPAFLTSLKAGSSGIKLLPQKEGQVGPSHVAGRAEINFADFVAPTKIPGLDRVSLLALVAAQEAIAAANLNGSPIDLTTAGVYVGTGIGGVSAMEAAYEEFYLRAGARVKPLTVVQAMNNAAAAHVAMTHQCHGPVVTYSTACSSSAIAIGEAYRAIKHGYTGTVLAGGTEALLVPGTLRAWDALRTLALPDTANPSASCKPFDKARTGLVLAEGSAFIVLEAYETAMARGANIVAILSGYGCQTDATHLTKPDAVGQAATIQAALRDANLESSAISYINAHGTATNAGDIIETNAIKSVFGAATKLPVTSTKSMHGHVMGATGAVEFVASLLAMRERFIPPTINLVNPDPECDLDYVANQARFDVDLQHVMSNSFAFGGSNAVLIASKE